MKPASTWTQRSRMASHRKQSGIALFMVLMVSLIVTLLSVTLASSMINETRVTLTGRDQAIARQAAEAALRDAEIDIRCQHWSNVSGVGTFAYQPYTPGSTLNPRLHCLTDPSLGAAESIGATGVTTAGSCTSGFVAAPIVIPGTNTTATDYNACNAALGTITGQAAFSISGTGATAAGSVSQAPRYTIEVFSFENGHAGQGTPLYRIRARGYGVSPATQVDLEEVYRPW